MTYVPVPNPSGSGRPALPIDPKLLGLLEHSYRTGQRVTIDRSPDDPPGSADQLRRELIRAGYSRFPDRTIHKRFRDDRITFWMTDKRRQPR